MQTTKQTRRQARQLLRLCYANGALDEERAQRLLHRICQDKPRGCLPVLTQFRRLLQLYYAQHSAKIETTIPVPSGLASSFRAQLERWYGPGLALSYTLNPALLGGMRITVGSDVYDGSIQARLAALQERI